MVESLGCASQSLKLQLDQPDLMDAKYLNLNQIVLFMHREIGNFNLTRLKIFGVGMNHLQHINCLIRCPKTNTMIVTNSDLMSNSTITNHVPPPSRFLLRLSINLILHCALDKKNSSPVLFTRSVT